MAATSAKSSPGKLVVLSGPSGAGKSTVLSQLLARYPERLKLSVSATTRAPRPGEVDGKDYHFLDPQDFQRRRQAGEFLECVEVFGRGHWYGTLFQEVRPSLQHGQWVILEIDVHGAGKVVEQFPDAVTIFLRPESEEQLEQRLRQRATESEEVIQHRLATAQRELSRADSYQYQVVNNTVASAVDQIVAILINRGFEP